MVKIHIDTSPKNKASSENGKSTARKPKSAASSSKPGSGGASSSTPAQKKSPQQKPASYGPDGAPRPAGVGAPAPSPQQKKAMATAQKISNIPAQEPEAPKEVQKARKYQSTVLKARQGRETRGKLPSAPRDSDYSGPGFFPAQSPML